MTRRVYVAGPFAAKELLAKYADELRLVGYEVCSTWLESEHVSDSDVTDAELGTFAARDLVEVSKADVFVQFTAAAAGVPDAVSGGRHVELGYWLAGLRPGGLRPAQHRTLIVGRSENAFHRLVGLSHASDWHMALLILAGWLVDHERSLRPGGLPRAADEVA